MTKLEQIKAECRKAIELEERPIPHTTEKQDETRAYYEWRTHARTFSPAAAKALLVAIEALEEAADDCHIQASNALEQICQSWPDPVQSNS